MKAMPLYDASDKQLRKLIISKKIKVILQSISVVLLVLFFSRPKFSSITPTKWDLSI